jgi:hypothetical protein
VPQSQRVKAAPLPDTVPSPAIEQIENWGFTRAPPRPGALALLTSGDDCADLNAVILVVVRRIAGYGWRVIGVRNGTLDLMKRPAMPSRSASMPPMAHCCDVAAPSLDPPKRVSRES